LFVGMAVVDVAKSDDFSQPARLIDVAAPLAADADAGELQRFVRLSARAQGRIGGRGEEVAQAGGPNPQKRPTVDVRVHRTSSPLSRTFEAILQNSAAGGLEQ